MTKIRHIVLECLLLSVIIFSGTHAFYYDSPEQEDFRLVWKVFSRIGESMSMACEENLLEEFGLTKEICVEIANDRDYIVYDEVETRNELSSCDECLSIMRPIVTAVEAGKTYEDMKPVAMPLCYAYFNESRDGNGDVMCEGILDNFGPHLFYVLNETGYSAEEFCEGIQVCWHDEITTESSIDITISPGPGNPFKRRENNRRQTWRDSLTDYLPEWMTGKGSKSKRNLDDAIRVLQMADLHTDLEYAEGAPTDCGLIFCCRERYEGTGSAMRYGDYNCEIPMLTVELALNLSRTLNASFMMYSGDSNPSALWEETLEIQLEGSRATAAEMERLLGQYGIPVYPAIGNHEIYPTNQYYTPNPDIQEFNRQYAEIWKDLAGFDDEQMDNVEYAGFYTVRQRAGLIILGYNTNYGYTDNWYNLMNEHEEVVWKMFTFMRTTLSEARQNGDKVILVSHQITGGQSSMMWYSDEVLAICSEYADVIVLHTHGHYHTDGYKMVFDENWIEPVGVQYHISSGTTPRNPSFRIYYLDPVTFDVLDYDHYYMLFEEVADLEPSIDLYQHEYRATEAYGMVDLSPDSWLDLWYRMDADDDLYNTYYSYKYTQNGDTCTGECKENDMCGIYYATYLLERECRGLSGLEEDY